MLKRGAVGFLKAVKRGRHRPSVLATWLYPKDYYISHIFMTGGGFTTWSKVPRGLASYPPIETR